MHIPDIEKEDPSGKSSCGYSDTRTCHAGQFDEGIGGGPWLSGTQVNHEAMPREAV